MRAGFALESKSRMRESWALMLARLLSSCSRERRLRSADLPDGSPIIPVAPPARAMGWWQWSWNRRRASWPTRLPTCRESPVGSNPQYNVSGPDAERLVSPSRSVQSATSPRQFLSSAKVTPQRLKESQCLAIVTHKVLDAVSAATASLPLPMFGDRDEAVPSEDLRERAVVALALGKPSDLQFSSAPTSLPELADVIATQFQTDPGAARTSDRALN